MPVPARMIAVAAFLVAVYGVVRAASSGGVPDRFEMPAKDLHSIRKDLGDWIGEDEAIDPRLFAATGAEAVVDRVYRNRAGETVLAHVAAFTNFLPEVGVTLPHKPQECYAGNGYRLAGERDVPLRITDQPARGGRLLTFERESQLVFVLYWYELDGKLFITPDGLRPIVWQLRGREVGPPLVKVMLQTSAADARAAEDRLKDLAVPLAAEIAEYH